MNGRLRCKFEVTCFLLMYLAIYCYRLFQRHVSSFFLPFKHRTSVSSYRREPLLAVYHADKVNSCSPAMRCLPREIGDIIAKNFVIEDDEFGFYND